jgi:nucleotide-binding universal stress UspA family protein
VTDADTTARSVIIWVCEGTWQATVDAALSLVPAIGSVGSPARFTVLHVTPTAAADAARGAYLGLLGRRGRDPGARFDEVAAAAAADLMAAAARRLGRPCEQLEIRDHSERAVVTASADADLLIVARDGDRSRLGPKSLGRATRFVVDHAACPVLLVWPDPAPGVGTMPPPPHHPHHGGP